MQISFYFNILGIRFAKMQTLAGLITFLKKYNVELADGMPTKVEFEPAMMSTISTCGLRIKANPRVGWEQRTYAQ